jgi:hypothetical protein
MPITGGITIYPDAAEKVTDTPEMGSLLVRVAKDALNAAYSAAPERTGDYRSSLFARIKDDEDTPTAMLASSSWYWHWIEFGSINNEPANVLGSAVQSVVEVYVPT